MGNYYVNQEKIEIIELFNFKDVLNLKCQYLVHIIQNQNKLNLHKIIYLNQQKKNKFLIQQILINKLYKKCLIMQLRTNIIMNNDCQTQFLIFQLDQKSL
ncbi:unnamed protein product [Paramecium primaurelia]|uniref:Uncharacterized protein n=1 Tax=Paramecium primaurelia TaxID=5886 RepID=A0A8S1Q9S7_PARPR|nr:unnamed protein product [Paramecium primaurelia]